MRKNIVNIFCTVCGLAIAWVFISWAEVAMFNLSEGHTYASWNAFNLMVKYFC